MGALSLCRAVKGHYYRKEGTQGGTILMGQYYCVQTQKGTLLLYGGTVYVLMPLREHCYCVEFKESYYYCVGRNKGGRHYLPGHYLFGTILKE